MKFSHTNSWPCMAEFVEATSASGGQLGALA